MLQLYLSAGQPDYLGNIMTEDRYIIVDSDGMDLFGEHFSKEDAESLIK